MLIRGRDLTIANVGDSRCVAAEMRGTELVAVDLTSDQTPYRCFPLLQLRESRPFAGTDWRCMSRCAALGVVRLAPQAAGIHHKTANYTKMPREDFPTSSCALLHALRAVVLPAAGRTSWRG